VGPAVSLRKVTRVRLGLGTGAARRHPGRLRCL